MNCVLIKVCQLDQGYSVEWDSWDDQDEGTDPPTRPVKPLFKVACSDARDLSYLLGQDMVELLEDPNEFYYDNGYV